MAILRDVVIVGYGRSPIGIAERGALSAEHPSKISTEVFQGMHKKISNLPYEEIDDIIMGCAFPEDVQGLNFSRVMSQRIGIPNSVTAQTTSRFSASGFQSLILGANSIASGEMDVIVAGGVEFMSTLGIDESAADPYVLKNADELLYMSRNNEDLAKKMGYTREQLDDYALQSHKKAAAAIKKGHCKDEIIPVTFTDKNGRVQTFSEDEHVDANLSKSVLDKADGLSGDYKLCTDKNSARQGDGVGFVVMMSAKKAKKLKIKPIAKLLGSQVKGFSLSDEKTSLAAVDALMKRLGRKADDFDTVEIHEAFAPQAMQMAESGKIDPSKINPRGGAIALGNPLGAAGMLMMCRTLSHLKAEKKKSGLLAMVSEGGISTALALEMC